MPEQVGGYQEVFVQVKEGKRYSIERAITAIERLGGRVLHAYPPTFLVASVPQAKVKRLVGRGGIASADTEPIATETMMAAGRENAFAYQAWNEHLSLTRRMHLLDAPEMNMSWDAPNRLPPDPPAEVQQLLRAREAELAPRSAAPMAAGAPIMSIPVLVGRIGVGLVFVDSSVSQFQITDKEKAKVISETTEGLNMLSGFEPRANIQWFYDIKRPKISLAASQFTNANKNSWEDIWRDAAMKALGYSGDLNGMNKYIADVKKRMNAAWAYAIFVTKYPITWFAYEWGNHVVMDFNQDGWGIDNFNLVVAHETGHVFGCPDEYGSSGCNCNSVHGRYQVANGNCENCANPSIACLMSHNSQAVCDYTRGHLGWNELAVQSKGDTTLKGTWTFDFDSGVQGPASGADIWWEQVNNVTRFLVPQSGAMLNHMGTPNFDAVSLQTLKSLSYTSTPINGSNNAANKLKAGTVVAIKTNAGRYAKMKVEAYGYNLNIRWVTYK